MTTRAERMQRRRRVDALASTQGWVISRHQLHQLGVDRHAIAAEVAARRWFLPARHTVAVRTGALTILATQWCAIWETGAGAVLGGVTALQAAGLTGFDSGMSHVSVLRGHSPRRLRPVRLHELTTRLSDEVDARGVPRVRPGVAALRAAGWAVSDRQAALLLVLPVQQRLVSASRLEELLPVIPLQRRRGLIHSLVRDIADGAESLGELDFAGLCRQWGLPEPSRQVLRQGPNGRIYLDVRWDALDLVVEIEGIHHEHGLQPVDDSLRQNDITLSHDRVLRIPVLGLRLQPSTFMRQVVAAHRQAAARAHATQ
ncbi:hypothetical protein [Leekyejoonella antrihumi]|uniref:DUF559 domain-containing protein n=1 Tax=Leekyejoonella antrihumi TaxID=1660198 RepID=A0A563E0T4_9MICO|nr:hypothetical protein [Leekyejoonella antrihumi]TWP36158.1 hypothetical protein FGL98_10675 [Leekyejoonella antrihumi]